MAYEIISWYKSCIQYIYVCVRVWYMQWCLINGCCTCHAQPRIFKKGDDVSPLWQAVAEGSGGRHGLAGGDKGLESGALKIAKQTLRRRMRRAVWIGDFGTDNYWLVLSGFKESLLMCFYVQHSAIIFGKMTKIVEMGWSPHYDELIGTVSEGCQYWEGNTVPIVQHARAETGNFRMERWVEPSSLESVYFFSMVLKLCQSRVLRDCSPSKQSKLLHAQKYIDMERERDIWWIETPCEVCNISRMLTDLNSDRALEPLFIIPNKQSQKSVMSWHCLFWVYFDGVSSVLETPNQVKRSYSQVFLWIEHV